MKSSYIVIVIIVITAGHLKAQNPSVNSGIDIMLIKGNYEKVIDTCNQILAYDSLNPEIFYKMGIACQNILEEDLSLNYFSRAAALDPDNKLYNYMLAAGYYGKGKYSLAEPLLRKLCSIDSMNWVYAYYLTGIYMQKGKFDDAIDVCKRFLKKDSTNHIYLDRIAFAYLKKEDFSKAIDLYNQSLSVNNKNLSALKNLAYMYSVTMRSDTAIQLLTNGIEMDSSDVDLYVRRAQLYYLKKYTKRALDDYLVVLSTGDSSKIYLKRAGIGYCNNFQPKLAINYLLKAYNKDSSDFETCNYLGQSFYKLKDMKSSIYYYNKAIKLLTPINIQLGLTYILYAESQKSNGMYKEAIASYLKGQSIKPDPNIYMIIANLYDEKVNDRGKAIYYYQMFLDNLKNARMSFTPDYALTIKNRLEYLKSNPNK
jgi:tetratricopeptide (TPR) repeat protein